jgi:DNA segregation ATPase FtsK/SpoIIIE, S-DNA-T family
MILEGLLCGATAYSLYRTLGQDSHDERKLKSNVKRNWRVLMDSMGNKAENKINQEYQILKIFPKHYGFDMILSIPFGKKFLDVVALIPLIEHCYKANVMANLSNDRNTAYIRVHFLNYDISTKDRLRFNWFKTFYNIDGCMTKSGETLNVDSISEIKSPDNELVGYQINSKIPLGLSYDKIKSSYDTITKTLGKCFLNFNYKNMELETSIIHKMIADDTKFTPYKVKPWELYIAMGYDWNPIILDYSLNANSLIGGVQGSGKTNALISGFINLCNQCDGETYEDDFELMVCNMGEKNDLRVFRDVKQCKYYANNLAEVISMLQYLKKEMNRRNKLFGSAESFCFNIHQYNKLIKDKSKQLKVIHLIADEIADLMCSQLIQDLLWDLIRKSRSSGIYVTVATQRGSLENLSSEIKGQLTNKISFSQPNTASALTIMSGEDVAKRVMSLEKKRECLVDYAGGIKVAKTLYLDERMMEKLLKKCIVKENNKLNLDLDGNIIKSEASKNSKNDSKTIKNNEKTHKNTKKQSRFVNLKDSKKGVANEH